MEVRFVLAKTPSTENKQLMSFLLDNVVTFRKSMRMRIDPLVKAKKGGKPTPPVMYVGPRLPVIGYKNIKAELNKAHQTVVNLTGASDPLEEFWKEGIKRGMDEAPEKAAGEDTLAKKFTAKTAERERLRPSKKNGKVLPPAPKHQDDENSGDHAPSFRPSTAALRQMQTRHSDNSAPKTTSEMAMQSLGPSGDYMTSADPSAPIHFDDDPHMRKYWANNMVTPGV
jgi:hypothetical protein